MPAIPRLEQPLRDARVGLRLAAERDIPEILIAHQDDPQLHARLGLPRPPSGAELGRQMERADGERQAGVRVRLTIIEPGSDEFRGRISVHSIDWDSHRAELGVWLAPKARGRGVGRAALKLAANWLLGDCGLQQLQLLTEPDNEAMRHAAKAAGFVEQGTQLRSRIEMVVLSLGRDELPG